MPLPTYDEALAVVLDAVKPLVAETVPSAQALGRVLAADLDVPADFPAAARSAVDGFAVGSCGRVEFRIVGEVAAGGAPGHEVTEDMAMAVMTGALVPPGARAVVMVEDATVVGDRLRIAGPAAPGAGIDAAGSEARRGDLLARCGDRLGVAAHPAVMCAGLAEVPVYRRPRVGVLVTGDEVTDAGAAPGPGQVFDTNSFIAAAVCRGLGAEVFTSRRATDDEATTRRLLAELGADNDLVVTSGGVSAGRYDFVGKILREDPGRLLLRGTAIKPGRPMHVARLAGGTPIFGMPGYPASLLTCAFLYLVPALKALSGRREVQPRWLPAVLGEAQRYRPGRQSFARAALALEDGRWVARDPGSQLASHFLNFARVQGLVRLPTAAPPGHEAGRPAEAPAGATVATLHFDLELA